MFRRFLLALLAVLVALPISPAVAFESAPPSWSWPRFSGPFHAEGASIVDHQGQVVRLTGVNWFGLENADRALQYAWEQPIGDLVRTIAEGGFNTIRLPLSADIVDNKPLTHQGLLARNPELRGKGELDLVRAVLDYAAVRGVGVILDLHRREGGRPGSYGSDGFGDPDPRGENARRWLAAWARLAEAFGDHPAVIGADLYNEPSFNQRQEITWEVWRPLAELGGNALLAKVPHWLIFVEGTAVARDPATGQEVWFWDGGNLIQAAAAPVRLSDPSKLVYSAHEYGPNVYDTPDSYVRDPRGWAAKTFGADPQRAAQMAADFPRNLVAVRTTFYAYLAIQGLAPVYVGEFGSQRGNPLSIEVERDQLRCFQQHGLSFTRWALGQSQDVSDLAAGGARQLDPAFVNLAKPALFAGHLGPSTGRYAIRPGDTLWALAGQLLGNPARWPELFEANQARIADPNRIYPGQNVDLP
ncbi:MAG: cellulase family glycosylhydrolase [Chloroflexi bacterium]|nr:cellulase family glycosylhydrolase [Chloroflexota bacterium]